MCIICIELASKKMSKYDAELALVELRTVIDPEHLALVKAGLDVLDYEDEVAKRLD